MEHYIPQTVIFLPEKDSSRCQIFSSQLTPLVAVEKNKMTLVDVSTTLIHIRSRLLQSFSDYPLQIAPLDFQLHYDTLHRTTITVGQRFGNQQIRATTPKAILTINVSASVHHTL